MQCLIKLLLSAIAIKPAKVAIPKNTYVAMTALIRMPINDRPRKIKRPLLNEIGFTFGMLLNIDLKPFTAKNG